MKTQPERSEENEVKRSTDQPTNAPDVSLLIVGAGLTGLTLACDLARRSIDFRWVSSRG